MMWEKVLLVAVMGAATIIFTVSMGYLTAQACKSGMYLQEPYLQSAGLREVMGERKEQRTDI